MINIRKSVYLHPSAFLALVLLTLDQVLALQCPKPVIRTFNKEPPSTLQVAGIYAIAPAIPAVVLPMLTDTFRVTQDPSALLAVLLSKRIFIYILATLATAYAGWRASTSLPAGKSLDSLNREILKGEAPPTEEETSEDQQSWNQPKTLQKDEKKDEQIFASLDEFDGVNQNVAIALPFVLTTALCVSYLLSQVSTATDSSILTSNLNILSALSQLSTVSNLVVCLLFSAAEFRSSTVSNSTDEGKFPQKILSIPNIIALFSVLAASLLPLSQAWPFQNSLNIALAVTVSRAVAPFLMEESGSIRIIALALTGLAAYDVFSVFGTSFLSVQAAGAVDVSSISDSVIENTYSIPETFGIGASNIITAGEPSVMETVARSKLEGPWRPGLLEMVLVGRVSDVIGLGDVVFPACLVSWGFNFNVAYAYAAIGGYLLGSLLTEIVSTLGPVQGLPALIFLTPAMIGSVSLLAFQRGEIETVWGSLEEGKSDEKN